jgi:hypothetical protein
VIVAVQIETIEAVRNADAILSVPGIDAVGGSWSSGMPTVERSFGSLGLGLPGDGSAATMSRAEPDMRAEYDFSGGVRDKYAARFQEGSNVVVLAPDVAAESPTPEDVHETLRLVARRRARRRRMLEKTTTS